MASTVRIVVVGSLNVDLVATVDLLPRAGETITASALTTFRGGKGANQLVAAARQGATASIIGCVGDDSHGTAYRQALVAEGVNVEGLRVTAEAGTGTALIAVDRSGENLIIYHPGANARLTADDVRANAAPIQRADALLVQLESPLDAVLEAIRSAKDANVPTILNPSPLLGEFPWGRCEIDTLILNEGEARTLFQCAEDDLTTAAPSLQQRLQEFAVRRAVITRGARPTICVEAARVCEVPTLQVTPVDTVGAGDSFAGTLAVCLAEGEPLERAALFANCAGALATLKPGAQESIPTRPEVEQAARRLLEAPSGSVDS